MKKPLQYLTYLIIFIAGGMATYFIIPAQRHAPALSPSSEMTPNEKKKHPSVPLKFDPAIATDSQEIFNNDDALYSYVKKFGLKQSITHLHTLTATYGDCHQPAHKAGRFAYDLYANAAFSTAGSECHSGGLHGAIEVYFRKNGINHLTEDLNKICTSESNNFFSHQCIHGIGHGLMAWSNYALPDVLRYCDRLPKMADSCWSGAFMENVVGGLANHGNHHGEGKATKYLSDDPHYPCTIVEDKYKAGCYFYQTSRMIQIFNGDFVKVAQACSEANAIYHLHCFQSMGRDVGGRFRSDSDGAIKTCARVPFGTSRIHCLNGAVQDSFWDASGQDNALAFCRSLTDTNEQDSCYRTVFARATQILIAKGDLSAFCRKISGIYRKHCLLSVGI